MTSGTPVKPFATSRFTKRRGLVKAKLQGISRSAISTLAFKDPPDGLLILRVETSDSTRGTMTTGCTVLPAEKQLQTI